MRTRSLAVILVGVVVATIVSAGNAHAAPDPRLNPSLYATRYAEVHTVSVAYGPACVGQVTASISSDRYRVPMAGQRGAIKRNDGYATLSIGGTFSGVGEGLRIDSCRVRATMYWRNLRSGLRGQVSGPVAGMFFPAAPHAIVVSEVRTGPGPVRFFVTTDRPHLQSGPGLVNVY